MRTRVVIAIKLPGAFQAREHRGQAVEIVDVPGQRHAIAPRDHVEDLGRASQRPRMGLRHDLAKRGAARLEDRHWLARASGPFEEGEEGGRVAHRLDDQGDRIGVGVVDQRLGAFDRVEIGLVPGGDDVGERDPLAQPAIDDRCEPQAAALRRQPHIARGNVGPLHRRGRGGADMGMEVGEPDTVRAEHADTQFARLFGQCRLKGDPLGLPRFGESGSGAEEEAHALALQRIERLENRGWPEPVDHAIHTLGQIGGRRKAFLTRDLVTVRVHRVDRPVEAVAQERRYDAPGKPRRVGRGPDYGDGPRREKGHVGIAAMGPAGRVRYLGGR